ncbi:Uncharacterised protein [Arthrobacter agilis]|nr:Uncharacterised protein [Arthrobacter agilis]
MAHRLNERGGARRQGPRLLAPDAAFVPQLLLLHEPPEGRVRTHPSPQEGVVLHETLGAAIRPLDQLVGTRRLRPRCGLLPAEGCPPTSRSDRRQVEDALPIDLHELEPVAEGEPRHGVGGRISTRARRGYEIRDAAHPGPQPAGVGAGVAPRHDGRPGPRAEVPLDEPQQCRRDAPPPVFRQDIDLEVRGLHVVAQRQTGARGGDDPASAPRHGEKVFAVRGRLDHHDALRRFQSEVLMPPQMPLDGIPDLHALLEIGGTGGVQGRRDR